MAVKNTERTSECWHRQNYSIHYIILLFKAADWTGAHDQSVSVILARYASRARTTASARIISGLDHCHAFRTTHPRFFIDWNRGSISPRTPELRTKTGNLAHGFCGAYGTSACLYLSVHC